MLDFLFVWVLDFFFAYVMKHLQFVLVKLWMRGRGVIWSQTADGNIFQEYNSLSEGIVE